MKGKTTIQLFDINSGNEIYSSVNENLVTNAMRDLVNMLHRRLAMYELLSSDCSGTYYHSQPTGKEFLKNAFKGLILFGSAIEANPDNYFLSDNYTNIIGYAGGDYSGVDSYRGDYNASESISITNGIRFVWDFATDKANGTINCACLCPERLAGLNLGHRSATDFASNRPWLHSGYLGDLANLPFTINYTYTIDNSYGLTGVSGYSGFIGRIGTKAYYFNCSATSSNGTITIKTVEISNPDSFHFTDPSYSKLITTVVGTLPETTYWFRQFYIEQDCLYLIEYNYSSHAKQVKKLNPTNLAVLSTITIGTVSQQVYGDIDNMAFAGGYIYQLDPANSRVYKYSATDGSLVDTLTIPGSWASYTWLRVYRYSSNTILILRGINTGASRLGYLFNGTTWLPVSTGLTDEIRSSYRMYSPSPFLVGLTSGNTIKAGLDFNFLSTINNLVAPVIKTSAQTMKVTYELTW